ncbi:MAG: 2Fe-2S iron-sulfur cluster-binding protein [Chitinophagales bacterium]
MKFFNLKVASKTDMTNLSCYISLKLNKNYKKQFNFVSGQYVVIQIKDENGICNNRSYSLCGSINDNNTLSFCVKRVKDGFVSNYLCDKIKEGDTLSVSLPEGDFTLAESNAFSKENTVFISAGSGITPIKALIEELFDKNYKGNIYLIYGNNNINEVIFRTFLREAETKHKNFTYIPILKETPAEWDGEQGRLIIENIERLFKEYNLPVSNSSFYISGPQGIIDNSLTYLESISVSKDNIFTEKFFTPLPDGIKTNKNITALVSCDGKTSTLKFKGQENLLDASLKGGLNAEHSCRVGTCLSCTARLVSGDVISQDNSQLTEDHKRKNIILTCQSYAKSSNIEIDYDVVVDKGIFRNRNKIIALCCLLACCFVFYLNLPNNEAYFAKGEYNIGHEELECAHCHKDAPGTSRQQIQLNFRHLIGAAKNDIDFGKKEVGNDACLHCHERPNDNHPIYRFNEPKFKEAREAIHPEKCVSCHAEHQHKRVTIAETNYCVNCHKDVKIKNDPLDTKHQTLIDNEMWNTCIQCHDFHGNHEMQVPTKLNDTIPLKEIKDYFNDGKDPYGGVKKYIADLDSINNLK